MAPLDNNTVASDDEQMDQRRQKKQKMGEDSGLTDAQRRQLRRDQRDLAKKLAEDADEDAVDKARKKNNELFENVRYTREAVLDVENVDAIAEKFSKKADAMIQAPRYDALKLVTKLKNKLTVHEGDGASFFDWETLGLEAGVCFNSLPPRVSFLVGPLANVKLPEKRKVRVARQKKEKMEDLEEEAPEQMKKQKKNVDQLSQAERNLKTMRKTLSQRTNQAFDDNKQKYKEIKESQSQDDEKQARRELKARGREIDFVPFCINPKSFTQTVENIFNFSFLVKRGEAKIKMYPPQSSQLGLPTAGGCFIGPGDFEVEGPAKQCVMSFTMKDWRNLIEAYDLKECDVPHRKGTKQSNAFSQQQSPPEDFEDEEELVE